MFKDDLEIRKKHFKNRLFDRTVHPTQMYALDVDLIVSKINTLLEQKSSTDLEQKSGTETVQQDKSMEEDLMKFLDLE